MNVNLGAPYEAILKRMVERGYAGNQTEAIRQALIEMNRKIDEEEAELVHKAVEIEMAKVDSGEVKTYDWKEVKRRAGLG